MTAVIAYFRDFGGEVVSTGIPCADTSTSLERSTLLDALQIYSSGENDGGDEVLTIEARVGNGASSPLAQSGLYAYVCMQDSVNGRVYKERLPMPDLGMADDGSSNPAWLSETDASGNSISVANSAHSNYAILKGALEDAYVSPNGNTATLVKLFVPNKL